MRFLLLAFLGLSGCVTMVDGSAAGDDPSSPGSTGSTGSTGSPGSTGSTGTGSAGSTTGSDGSMPLDSAVGRAMEWVTAMVPYCQAANHEPDGDSACAATCDRPDNPAWDPYRSDCSGFVSWAWGLAAPGHTTATFAPFDTSVSTAIEGADLQPGDALNNDTHSMLFVAWTTDDMSEAQLMDEPGCSSSQPYAREITLGVSISGESVTVDGYGTFTAIRQK